MSNPDTNNGCPHMTCKICNHHFCYTCLEPLAGHRESQCSWTAKRYEFTYPAPMGGDCFAKFSKEAHHLSKADVDFEFYNNLKQICLNLKWYYLKNFNRTTLLQNKKIIAYLRLSSRNLTLKMKHPTKYLSKFIYH
jgi:hypothetical protein